ncbi:MAG: DUF885 family protein [Bacillota bacterium]|jgi:ElaB/YqjD/DUF883 family membrane-anchored ribosome-binding protein
MREVNDRTDLVEVYRQFDGRCVEVGDRMAHRREYETESFVPSIAEKEEMARKYCGLLDEAKALPTPDPVFTLLNTHFQDFLNARLSDLETTFVRPGRFVDGFTQLIEFTARHDSRSAGERQSILSKRLATADEVWKGTKSLFPHTQDDEINEVVEAAEVLERTASQARDRVAEDFRGLSDSSLEALRKAYDDIGNKAFQWAKEARCALAERPKGSKMSDSVTKEPDIPRYRVLLQDELGVSLDSILQWHQEEVDKTREECFEIASKLNLGATPHPKNMAGVADILNKFEGPCDTPDEMFLRQRGYLDRAQAECRKYIRMPEEHVNVIPTPEHYKDNHPWGGYYGGCPRRRPISGATHLNVDNYKAVTDGWIRMCAIHECYPGHHMQWVRSVLDPLPETVKMGAKGMPLFEGTAHRSERLFEYVFPDDPFYPLFVAYRRHHTATRIKADLWLMYFGRPIDDVVQLYMDEMGFDRWTARGQVKAQELMVGYFNCYYYGMKRLEELEAKYGYDKRTFTEYLFSMPRVSLETFERFLELHPEDKRRVLNDFPSVYMGKE